MWLTDNVAVLESLSYLVTILTLPGALIVFTLHQRRERWARRRETYQSANDEYIELIRSCLDHPDLAVLREEEMLGVLQNHQSDGMPVSDLRRKWMLYTLLINSFEHAYLVFAEGPSKTYRKQWKGWEDWALDYLRIDEFRRVWRVIGKNFDADFYAHVTTRMEEEGIGLVDPRPAQHPTDERRTDVFGT